MLFTGESEKNCDGRLGQKNENAVSLYWMWEWECVECVCERKGEIETDFVFTEREREREIVKHRYSRDGKFIWRQRNKVSIF